MPEPTHAWETLTYKAAEKLLLKNDVNRNLRVSVVDKYQRDMEAGNWKLCMAPIVIAEDGRILDGQHRLTAQIRAMKQIKWLVIRNAPAETQKTIDTGAGRSVGDVLQLEGHANSGLLAAVARNVQRIVNGQMGNSQSISNSEILDVIRDHPDIVSSTEAASAARQKSMTPIAPSVLGAAHWMISQVNGRADADIFLWRIASLTGERDGSPVLALARRCNEIRRMQQRVQHRDYLAMVIKAWNLDARDKSVVKISTYSKTGGYVLPEVAKRTVSLAESLDDKDHEEAETGIRADDDEHDPVENP